MAKKRSKRKVVAKTRLSLGESGADMELDAPWPAVAGGVAFQIEDFLRDASPDDLLKLSPQQARAVQIAILEWSRLSGESREDRAEARAILKRTKNPSAALRFLGITKGDEGKGRSLDPSLLHTLYEQLMKKQGRVRREGEVLWVDLNIADFSDDAPTIVAPISVRVEGELPLDPGVALVAGSRRGLRADRSFRLRFRSRSGWGLWQVPAGSPRAATSAAS